jgi:hypothetical protein
VGSSTYYGGRYYGDVGLTISGTCKTSGYPVSAYNAVGWYACINHMTGYAVGTNNTTILIQDNCTVYDGNVKSDGMIVYDDGTISYESWLVQYCDGSDPIEVKPPMQPC